MLLTTAAVADGALRVAALIDIQRRPVGRIRGRKGKETRHPAPVPGLRHGCRT